MFLCTFPLSPCLGQQREEAGYVAEREAPPDSLTLYFYLDHTDLDPGYMDNAHMLGVLDRLLCDSLSLSRLDSLHIHSASSPEGRGEYNARLAEQRAESVRVWLLSHYPFLERYQVHTFPHSENWAELVRLVRVDPAVPRRQDVLQILDRIDSLELRKELLRGLDGGTSYRYLEERLFPYMRRASVDMVSVVPAILPQLPRCVPGGAADVLAFSAYTGMYPQVEYPAAKRPVVALKTNLLFDAALMPNIEIEVPLGRRWSVNGEYIFPWWILTDNQYCLEILSGGIEGRCWLGNRKKRPVLTGHFLGLYAGGGMYDLQWRKEGYQGEFFIASGLSYGYSHRIGRNLNMEFSLGLGMLRTYYRHYHMSAGYEKLLWQNSGNYTWLGPTKLKVSLVWLLQKKVKIGKGGRR